MKINIDSVKKIIVEINDKDYEVAERTLAKERALNKISKNSDNLTHYQYEKAVIIELIGKTAYDELFPVEDEINMDFMELVYNGLIEAYGENEKERKRKEEESITTAMIAQLKPIADMTNQLDPALKATQNLNREQRRQGSKLK